MIRWWRSRRDRLDDEVVLLQLTERWRRSDFVSRLSRLGNRRFVAAVARLVESDQVEESSGTSYGTDGVYEYRVLRRQ